MLDFVFRLATIVIGLAFLVDAGFSTVSETLVVDRHSVSHSQDSDHRDETHYNIEFAGGTVASCSMGYSAYSQLRDGDIVTVESSRILKNCVRISKRNETVYHDAYRKWFLSFMGLMFFASGMGWIKTRDRDCHCDEKRGFFIRW